MFELIQTLMNTVTTAGVVSPPSSLSKSNTIWPMGQSKPIINESTKRQSCDNLPEYTLAEVSEHWQTNDCWVVVEDLVYDITEFVDEHPGGQYIVMEHAGRDATLVFRGSRHSQDAYNMLDKYLIGILVEVNYY